MSSPDLGSTLEKTNRRPSRSTHLFFDLVIIFSVLIFVGYVLVTGYKYLR